MDDEFMKQFSGSASANVVTVMLLGLIMIIKKCVEKNKHSECKSCCFSFSVDNKTERNKDEFEHTNNESKSEDEGDDEESVHKLHGGHDRRVREESV